MRAAWSAAVIGGSPNSSCAMSSDCVAPLMSASIETGGIGRAPDEIFSRRRRDGLVGEVGVEGSDDGSNVCGVVGDDGEVARGGVVAGHQVEGHDGRGCFVDRDGLLVGNGEGRIGPVDGDMILLEVGVGGRVASLLVVLVEDDTDRDACGSSFAEHGGDGDVGQLVHGDVDGFFGRGDQVVDGGEIVLRFRD